MTPISIAVSFIATFLLIVVLGHKRFLGQTIPASVGIVVGLTVGWALLDGLGGESFWGILMPREAKAWIPWIFAVAAGIDAMPHITRVVAGVGLSAAIPVRLLWGSYYSRPEQWNSGFAALVVLWAIAISVAWLVPRSMETVSPPNQPKIDWLGGIVWLLVASITSVCFATTGSLNYGATMGLIAVAALASWMTAGRPAPLLGVAWIAMIGLASAFSELDWGHALGLATASILAVIAERFSRHPVRVTVLLLGLGIAVVTGGLVMMPLFSEPEPSGYYGSAG